MNTDASPPLLVTHADGVRTLTLNRPQRRNAIDTALAALLLDALAAADEDPAVGAVLLAGNGPVFCAGADLGEFKAERAHPQAEQKRSELFLQLQLGFERMQAPVVCAVSGAAVGAGASLAIGADLTVIGAGARIAYPEIVHGMVPGLMIAGLQGRAGRKAAFELLATGDPLAASDALALGLVNRVVPDAEVLPQASALARQLAGRDRAAMRETKRLFTASAELPAAQALQLALEASRQRRLRAAGEIA